MIGEPPPPEPAPPPAGPPDPAGPPAGAPGERSTATWRPAVVYTGLRLAVFALVFAVLLVPLRNLFLAALLAALLSGALSYVVLRRQREALAGRVTDRMAARRVRARRRPPEDVSG